MKQRIIALRYLLGAFAVSAALSLVCFAQAASPRAEDRAKGLNKPALQLNGRLIL